MLSKNELITDLKNLGVREGETLVVHSSLRAIGKVEGGTQAVIESLLEVVGASGTLVMPTFTYTTPVFDPQSTPCETGILPEIGRSFPNAVRSWHPTYSVVAIGPRAEELSAGHHLLPGGVAMDSPLDRVAKRDGKILLLGVGHVANSTIHVGESHARVAYLDVPFWPDIFLVATVVIPPEEFRVETKEHSGCSKAFGAIEGVLRERGAIQDGIVGKALSQLMPSQSVIDATVDVLRENPASLLCSDPRCYRCTTARLRLLSL